MTDPTRVVIADEHALFRSALRVALEHEPDLTVVAEAADGLETVREVARTEPDVALVDATLPLRNGAQTCAEIKSLDLPTKVLVVSSTFDHGSLVAALEAGADGYIAKESRLADFVDGTRALMRGEACIPPRMLGTLLQELIQRRRRDNAAMDLYRTLSRREREVLSLLAKGNDQNAIAERLVISAQTSRTHIQNVLSKLGVHSRLEAMAFAVDHDLVDPMLEE